MFIEDDKYTKFIKKIRNWIEVDAKLKAHLLMKTLDRAPPTDEAINKEREDVWPPFITKNGSVLNNLNAVR